MNKKWIKIALIIFNACLIILLVLLLSSFKLWDDETSSEAENFNRVDYNTILTPLPSFFGGLDQIIHQLTCFPKWVNDIESEDLVLRLQYYPKLGRLLAANPIIKGLGISEETIFQELFDPSAVYNERMVRSVLYDYMIGKSQRLLGLRNTHIRREAKPRESYAQEGIAFFMQHYSDFAQMEAEIGVDKFTVAGILTVETRNGIYTGTYNVLGSFAAIASVNTKELIEPIIKKAIDESKKAFREADIEVVIDSQGRWNYTGKDGKPYQIDFAVHEQELREILTKRMPEKTAWGLENLLVLFILNHFNELSIKGLTGSYAGAFGLCQFLPNSFLQWAKDGNGDGIINLFNPSDAIFSCGNYLKEAGFDGTPQGNYDAIYHYNHSDYYVRKVQAYARRIKELYYGND